MAHLDENVLDNLTKLCRIQCSDAEKARLLKNLEQILHYVDQLNAIDTEGVKPCNSVLDLQNVTREDVIDHEEILERSVLLSNAPSPQAQINGMIRVPTIIRKKGA